MIKESGYTFPKELDPTTKEQVSLSRIKKDLMRYLYGIIIDDIVTISSVWLLLLLFNIIIVYIESLTLTVIFLSLYLLAVIDFLYHYIKIKKAKFTIRSDILRKKRDKRLAGMHSARISRPHRLYFHRGYFDLCQPYYYAWSSSLHTTRESLYNFSSIDDIFTVVQMNKTIWIVYNQKFFDVLPDDDMII